MWCHGKFNLEKQSTILISLKRTFLSKLAIQFRYIAGTSRKEQPDLEGVSVILNIQDQAVWTIMVDIQITLFGWWIFNQPRGTITNIHVLKKIGTTLFARTIYWDSLREQLSIKINQTNKHTFYILFLSLRSSQVYLFTRHFVNKLFLKIKSLSAF